MPLFSPLSLASDSDVESVDGLSHEVAVQAPDSAVRSSERDAEPVEPEPTPVQRAIGAILKSDTRMDIGHVVGALMQLDARPLPRIDDADQLVPRHNPHRSACFGSLGLWSAHRICQRCSVLNELMKIVAHDASNAAVNMLGQALVTTECISDSVRTGNTPGLPLELLDMIVDCVLDDMSQTKDGKTVAALMHTSIRIRFKCAEAFVPVALLECDVTQQERTEKLYIRHELFSFICNMVHHAFVIDFSTKRYGKAIPPYPECTDIIMTTLGAHGQTAKVTVEINSDNALLSTGQVVVAVPEAVRHRSLTTPPNGSVGVRNVCRLLEKALIRFGHGLCCTNPYMRALSGSFGVPTTGASICVKLRMQLESGVSIDKGPCRFWQLDTQIAGNGHPSA